MGGGRGGRLVRERPAVDSIQQTIIKGEEELGREREGEVRRGRAGVKFERANKGEKEKEKMKERKRK